MELGKTSVRRQGWFGTGRSRFCGCRPGQRSDREGKADTVAKEHALVFEGDMFSLKQGDEVIVRGMFNIDASRSQCLPYALSLSLEELLFFLQG